MVSSIIDGRTTSRIKWQHDRSLASSICVNGYIRSLAGTVDPSATTHAALMPGQHVHSHRTLEVSLDMDLHRDTEAALDDGE